MSRFILCYAALLLTALSTVAAPESEKADDPKGSFVIPPIVELLRSQVKYPGIEKDERLTLKDALEQLNELYDLPILVNEEAFRQDNVPDVLETTPVAGSAFP